MEHALSLFGSIDENVRMIEREYNVSVVTRGTQLKISGEPEDVMRAVKTVQGLLTMLDHGEALNEQSIRYVIDLVSEGNEDKIGALSGDCI